MSLSEIEFEPALPSTSGRTEWPLIGPQDPAPFSVINPQGKAPVLLVCDHASKAFPAAMHNLGLADWVLEKHVACDIGAAQVTKHLSKQLDAPAVLAGYSRLIVDLNRKLHDPAAFTEVSDGISIPGNLDLDEYEKEERTRSFFNPYHDEVTRQIKLLEDRGVVPAFLSIHTCTPVFNNVVRECHIGVMWDKDPRIPIPLMEALRKNPDIMVGDNEPYSGRHPHDFTIDHHAEPTGLAHVGIEVRQDLVSTPEGAEKWGGILGEAFEIVLSDPDIYTRL